MNLHDAIWEIQIELDKKSTTQIDHSSQCKDCNTLITKPKNQKESTDITCVTSFNGASSVVLMKDKDQIILWGETQKIAWRCFNKDFIKDPVLKENPVVIGLNLTVFNNSDITPESCDIVLQLLDEFDNSLYHKFTNCKKVVQKGSCAVDDIISEITYFYVGTDAQFMQRGLSEEYQLFRQNP